MSCVDAGGLCASPAKKRWSGRSVRRQGWLLPLSALGLQLAAAVLGRGSVFVGAGGPYRGVPLRRVGLIGRRQSSGQPVSSFQGVRWHPSGRKWQAILLDPKTNESISMGIFDSEIDAAKVVDMATLGILGRDAATNFNASKYKERDIKDAGQSAKSTWEPRPSSTYNGVYNTRGDKKWRAEFTLYRKSQFLGFYETEEEAARAHDQAVRCTSVEKTFKIPLLNFPEKDDYFDEQTWEDEQMPRGFSSAFLGVTFHVRSGQYKAKVGLRVLGLFDTEVEAARAFDKASLARGGPTNFMPPVGIEA